MRVGLVWFSLLGTTDHNQTLSLVKVLFQNWHPLEVEKNSSQAHTTRSWYLSEIPTTISDEQILPFCWGGGGGGAQVTKDER